MKMLKFQREKIDVSPRENVYMEITRNTDTVWWSNKLKTRAHKKRLQCTLHTLDFFFHYYYIYLDVSDFIARSVLAVHSPVSLCLKCCKQLLTYKLSAPIDPTHVCTLHSSLTYIVCQSVALNRLNTDNAI